MFLFYALKYIILRKESIDITKLKKKRIVVLISQLTSFKVWWMKYMVEKRIKLNNFCFKEEYLM